MPAIKMISVETKKKKKKKTRKKKVSKKKMDSRVPCEEARRMGTLSSPTIMGKPWFTARTGVSASLPTKMRIITKKKKSALIITPLISSKSGSRLKNNQGVLKS
jgi:hypothetical protein